MKGAAGAIQKAAVESDTRANRAGTISAGGFRPLLDCIGWTVPADCNGPRLAVSAELYLLIVSCSVSRGEHQAAAESIKPRMRSKSA